MKTDASVPQTTDQHIEFGMAVARHLLRGLAEEFEWRLCDPDTIDKCPEGWSVQHGEGDGAVAIAIRVEHSNESGDSPAMLCFTAELYSLRDGEWRFRQVLWTETRRPEKGEQENIIVAFLQGPIRRAMKELALRA